MRFLTESGNSSTSSFNQRTWVNLDAELRFLEASSMDSAQKLFEGALEIVTAAPKVLGIDTAPPEFETETTNSQSDRDALRAVRHLSSDSCRLCVAISTRTLLVRMLRMIQPRSDG
jgi:hypothetical protein